MIQFYDTLTRTKRSFYPLDPHHVRFYVCGPTVYDAPHIGNARPVAIFDVLYRFLSYLYPKVTYVRNVTDVDDKIMTMAHDKQESITQVTKRALDFYHHDMAAIGALSPTVEPFATQHIDDMIQMISTLIDKGVAYVAEGHVLFDVTQDAAYGTLSKRTLEDMRAGARVEIAPYKKNAMDFVLWKPSHLDQPGWESPWGRGRPGWHIECSAMSKRYLGQTFDIHGGGIELSFPHHENEMAQNRCAHDGAPMAQFWMHNGHLLMEGEKMSKSLGNIVTVRQLLNEWPGEVIRWVLLGTQYRQPLDWKHESLKQAYSNLSRLYRALSGYEGENADPHPDVIAALKNDLNIPQAMSVLHNLAGEIHKASHNKKELQATLKGSGTLMGFLQNTNFLRGKEGIDADIEQLIQERSQARLDKDFKKADEIRHDLEQQGISLEDTPEGTLWKR